MIRTPSSFYVVHKIYIWTGIVSLLFFSCIIVLFGINILARKRAEEAVRRLAEEKAVMAEIGRIISSTLNIDEVYVRFVEEVRKLIPFDGIAINIIDRPKGLVTVPHVSGLGVPGCQPGDALPLDGSVTGAVAQTLSGLIVQLQDRNELPARFPTLSTAFEVGVRALIVVPLLSKDQVIGAIHFRSTKPNAYSEQDLKLAQRIADQIAGAVANAQLFSDRARAEGALRESERRFSVFMEHLPAAVFIKDQSDRLLFANRYLQEIFGWKECVGKTTAALLPREIAERMIADDRRILSEGPLVIQERIIDIRGVERFFDTYKFPIPAEGAHVLLGAISVDNTQRIRTERELANTKVLLQSAFEQTPVPMVLVSAPDGILLNLNRASIEMLGVEDEEEPAGQFLIEIHPTWQDFDAEGKPIPWAELPLSLALQGMTTRNKEMFVRRKDGSRRWEMVNAAPIYNEEGEMIAALVVFPDITERKQAEEALRESEAKYRRLHETMMDAFVNVDMTGRIREANRAYQALVGYSEEELRRLTYMDLTPEKWHDFERDIIEDQIFVQGHSEVYEKEYRRKDGTIFPVELRTFLMRDDRDNPVGMWAIVRDITERKQTEAELRESEKKYRSVIENIQDVFYRSDSEGSLLMGSPSGAKMFGYDTIDEMIGLPLDSFWIDPKDRERLLAQIKATGGVKDFEAVLKRKDGTTFDASFTTHFVFDDYGNFQGTEGIIRDITQRTQAEAALRESEEKFRNLVETTSDWIWETDAEGRYSYASPRVHDLLGYEPDEVIGRKPFDFMPPEEAERSAKEFARFTAERRPFFNLENVNLHQDGKPVILETSGVPRLDFQGNFHGYRGIDRDVTERKRSEEERSKLEAQMREVQKLESLGVLAGGIAHDFNNLLMAILGNADLALLSLSPASPARHNIEEVVNASQRAADLCRQMLAYSGRGRFVLGRYDLSEIVREMTHILQVSVSKKATMRYRFTESLPAVEADATQLRQVVMNLITNASDALGDQEGSIQVSSGIMECDRVNLSASYLDDNLPEGRYVYLEVSDTGCGMDAETRSRIFDPFFTTKVLGRGLGLAAVLGIVRGHKGAIQVYSEPGKGTTFKILFPAVDWTPVDRTRSAEQRMPPPLGGTALLVDDDESVLNVASLMLERLGFTVLTASDGQKGLDVFRERAAEIDCVLLDLSMPRLSGEEVFREMRRIRGDVRVILSSGYNEHEVTQRFVGQGLAGFVQKPYTLEKLREILRRVLG